MNTEIENRDRIQRQDTETGYRNRTQKYRVQNINYKNYSYILRLSYELFIIYEIPGLELEIEMNQSYKFFFGICC